MCISQNCLLYLERTSPKKIPTTTPLKPENEIDEDVEVAVVSKGKDKKKNESKTEIYSTIKLGALEDDILQSVDGFNRDETEELFRMVSTTKPQIGKFSLSLAACNSRKLIDFELYSDPQYLINNFSWTFYRTCVPLFYGTMRFYDLEPPYDKTKDRMELYSYDTFEGIIISPVVNNKVEKRLMICGTALMLHETKKYTGTNLKYVFCNLTNERPLSSTAI